MPFPRIRQPMLKIVLRKKPMFTGLIQALGKIRVVDTDRLYLSVSSDTILKDLMIGDSVAVDGVCLTVEEILSLLLLLLYRFLFLDVVHENNL